MRGCRYQPLYLLHLSALISSLTQPHLSFTVPSFFHSYRLCHHIYCLQSFLQLCSVSVPQGRTPLCCLLSHVSATRLSTCPVCFHCPCRSLRQLMFNPHVFSLPSLLSVTSRQLKEGKPGGQSKSRGSCK